MSPKDHSNIDPEKAAGQSDASGSGPAYPEQIYAEERPKGPWTKRVIDSFKRDPNASVLHAAVPLDGGGFDHKAAAERTANSGLARKLKSRHLQMIAIGGSIGESNLFLFSILLAHDAKFICALLMVLVYRHWSVRHFWCCSFTGWPSILDHCVWYHWHHVILHRKCPGRDGCSIPYFWFILRLFYPFPGSCMGLCHGLEVSIYNKSSTCARK